MKTLMLALALASVSLPARADEVWQVWEACQDRATRVVREPSDNLYTLQDLRNEEQTNCMIRRGYGHIPGIPTSCRLGWYLWAAWCWQKEGK
jgi:hypothetical protein